MNLRLYLTFIIAALILVGPASAEPTATIHGVVYGWDTFDPLDNAVVAVNSTPSQSMVAKYGLYSFELAPGSYTITASYYQNSTLTYQAEETITVEGEGNYVLDLLLLPAYSQALMNNSAENEPAEEIPSEIEASFSTQPYLPGAVLAILLLAGGYVFSQMRKRKEELPAQGKNEAIAGMFLDETFSVQSEPPSETLPHPEPPVKIPKPGPGLPEKGITEEKEILKPYSLEQEVLSSAQVPKRPLPLPADLQEVMDIIRGQGGRITQKELRSRLKYSEGKVSLMLADLERRELVEKFKRGRGNVIILRDDEKS